MAKTKKETKENKATDEKMAFAYSCPACSQVAIETSNKMLGVEVDCKACGKRIKLDNPDLYKKL